MAIQKKTLSNSVLAAEERVALYRSMLRLRRVEEEISRRYAEQEMRCPTHLCIGQEAIPVGISALLKKDDYVFSGHRSHGHYLAKGGDLKAMIAELYGREAGCAAGRGGSQHLIDLGAGFVASAPILAGTVSIAVGAAMASKWRKDARISVVYFGDGALEEGVCHEAMNFASIHKLPVIFVCENNLYSVHSDLSVRQPANRTIAEVGAAHGIVGVSADGNDVERVWDVAKTAVDAARSGKGPALIEFRTYRWLEHCGPNEDFNLSYRTREEFDAWRDKCPVENFEAKLRDASLYSDIQKAEDEVAIAAEITAAFDLARSSEFPSAATLGDFSVPQQGRR